MATYLIIDGNSVYEIDLDCEFAKRIMEPSGSEIPEEDSKSKTNDS